MIGKAIERRAGLEAVTDAYRLVHRDEIGAFSVDRYGDWLLVTGYDEILPSSELLKQLEPELANFKGGIVRTNRRDPHHRKLFSDMVAFGEPVPERFTVTESGLNYEISLNDSQHPGLFLDQRESRKRVMDFSKGKRVANLFSFTCSFSVAAVAGGAEVAFSVDLAAGCLDKGKRNFKLNGFADSGHGKFIKEDARKWLARQVRRQEKDPAIFLAWDLIVCDPPVFAGGKKGDAFSVEQEWPFLAKSVRQILAPGGAALFANNHRSGDDGFYFSELKKNFGSVESLPTPVDFTNTESPHVRTYWCC